MTTNPIDMEQFNALTLDEKRDYLTLKLQFGEVAIEFTKVDGTNRKMPCTLAPQLIPPAPIVEGKIKKERKENPTVIRVFCTDKQEWRSFRIDSVISINDIIPSRN